MPYILWHRHYKYHHIADEFKDRGHRSKYNVKVTNVKNANIPSFSLIQEKVVQCQGQALKVK